jgi:phage terminase large subunit-like protein
MSPTRREGINSLTDAALRELLRSCLRTRGAQAVAEALSPAELDFVARSWFLIARDEQLPPDFHHPGTRWHTWLFMAGRGAGKTRAGAEWVRARALAAMRAGAGPLRIALVAPTHHDARAVMVEGESGLLRVCAADGPHRPRFEPARRHLLWPDGTLAQLFSAEEPDTLRGPQFHFAWCDEIARWRRGQEVWDMLLMALRLGEQPQVLATTTPAPVPLLRRLLSQPGTWLSRARTRDNAANLAPGFITAMEARYGGTRLGRQELDGELLTEPEGTLFPRHLLEAAREPAPPPLARVIVAVDPPAGHGPGSVCGIIVAGIDAAGTVHILEDASLTAATPAGWARAAVAACHRHRADRLVAEVNQGGDMVEAVLRQVDARVPFRAVHASRGKAVRAEPVAALLEQGRLRLAGTFPRLEDELVMFEDLLAAGRSPDRADAFVWAVTDLALRPRARPRVRLA